jgi:hypothetical protein
MVDIYIKSTQWLNIKTVSKLTPLSNCVEMFPFRFVFFQKGGGLGPKKLLSPATFH